MSTPGSIGFASSAIERLVDEPVGLGVLLAADVTDRPARRSGASARFTSAWSSRRVASLTLYSPLTWRTTSSESPTSSSSVAPSAARPLDPEQQRPVLGDVVGRAADPLAALLEHARRRRPGRPPRSRPGPGLPRAPPSTLTTILAKAQPTGSRGGAAERRTRPPSPGRARSTGAPSRRAGRSRVPRSIWKTCRRSSPRSTPHWYQQRSQAKVIRTSLGEPAADADRDRRPAEGPHQAADRARGIALVEPVPPARGGSRAIRRPRAQGDGRRWPRQRPDRPSRAAGPLAAEVADELRPSLGS